MLTSGDLNCQRSLSCYRDIQITIQWHKSLFRIAHGTLPTVPSFPVENEIPITGKEKLFSLMVQQTLRSNRTGVSGHKWELVLDELAFVCRLFFCGCQFINFIKVNKLNVAWCAFSEHVDLDMRALSSKRNELLKHVKTYTLPWHKPVIFLIKKLAWWTQPPSVKDLHRCSICYYTEEHLS